MRDWSHDTLVRIDSEYDSEYASDPGGSRYDAYLRQYAAAYFSDHDFDVVRFATWAWQRATGPVMSPGYVRTRPDIASVTVDYDYDDGQLFVRIVVPITHHVLTHAPNARDWATAGYSWHDFTGLEAPTTNDAAAVLLSATMLLPGTGWKLPTSTDTEGPGLYATAREAVATLVDEINAAGAPLVRALRE